MSKYQQIYEVIAQIPKGRVTTYGTVSHLVAGTTPRMVGYALHALPQGSPLPWHRVINRQGRISLDADQPAGAIQRQILESEGIIFDESGKVDLLRFEWK